MAEYTKNYNLEKQQGNEYISIEGLNENFDKIDTALGNSAKFEKASGTGAAITLKGIVLEDGASKTFIASANNNGVATTINGKKLYKSGTTTAPSLIIGKAVTVWYSQANDCFYATAAGDADTLGGKNADAFVEKSVILPDKIDLNTAITTGFYTLPENPVNAPSGAQYGQLIVSRNAGSISQVVISIYANKMFYRAGNPVDTGGTGSWGTWQELSVSGHKHSKSDVTDFPTSLPANGGSASSLIVPDVRDENNTPGWYMANHPARTVVEFKIASVVGVAGSGYVGVITIVPYGHASGGFPFQYTVVGGGSFKYRYGLGENVWGAWKTPAVNGEEVTFPSIELSAGTPFIDFHFNTNSTDYTSRIIEASLGSLRKDGQPADVHTTQIRNIEASTGDLVAGSSPLNRGALYIVYE